MKVKKCILFLSCLAFVGLTGAQGSPLDLKLHSRWDDRERTVVTEKVVETVAHAKRAEKDDVPTVSNHLLPCRDEKLSTNAWLASHHTGKDHRKDQQEKNYGLGLTYSCDSLSVGLDMMRNSNNGKAIIASVRWSFHIIDIGPAQFSGSIGYARLSYEVPRYRATAYGNTEIAFLSARLKQWPKWSINVAPVPKMAGKALITWVTYEVYSFGD